MKLFIIISFTLIYFTALGQNNSIGFGVGLNDFHMRDNYTSPYNLNSVMMQSHLFYKHSNEGIIHSAEANFSKGTLNSAAKKEETTQYFGELSYSFSKVIYETEMLGNPMKLFVGTGLSTFFLINDNFTEKNITWYGANDKTWYWSHSINLETGGILNLGTSNLISARIGSPFFRNVSRPDVNHNFSSRNLDTQKNFLNAALNGKPEFIWDKFVLSCSIEFIQRLNHKLTFNASYDFNYSASDTPLTMRTYMNSFLVGLGISF